MPKSCVIMTLTRRKSWVHASEKLNILICNENVRSLNLLSIEREIQRHGFNPDRGVKILYCYLEFI